MSVLKVLLYCITKFKRRKERSVNMFYRLNLYKTTASCMDAPCIRLINKDIKNHRTNEAGCMEHFDAEGVEKIIKKYAVSDKGESLCKTAVCKLGNKEYVHIVTSAKVVKRVIAVVCGVATEYELTVYDEESGKTLYQHELYDKDFVNCGIRSAEINESLRNKYVRRLRTLNKTEYSADYVVTLRKKYGIKLEERICEIYEHLSNALKENEKLECRNKCFVISGSGYTLTYMVEAYGKTADRMGYISDGNPICEVMRRMSCETAFKWAEENLKEEDIRFGMCKNEMVRDYPNPADRFVHSINIRKQEKNSLVKYCGNYGQATISVVFDRYTRYDKRTVSSLNMCEEEFACILRIIGDYYPYAFGRYYGSSYLPYEMWEDVTDRIRKVRKLIVEDTFNDDLDWYIKPGDFYELSRNDEELYKTDFRQFVHKYRYEIAEFYTAIIEWSEKQLNEYDAQNTFFNVEGP